MLTLNLLPEQYKKEYEFEKRKRFIVFSLVSFGMIFLVFLALLFFTYAFLSIHKRSLQEALAVQRSTDIIKRVATLEKEVQQANSKISSVFQLNSSIRKAAPILDNLSKINIPGLYFTSITFDNDTRKVVINGYASRRELVLKLEKELSNNKMVKVGSLESPIQNILHSRDINFKFEFVVND